MGKVVLFRRFNELAGLEIILWQGGYFDGKSMISVNFSIGH